MDGRIVCATAANVFLVRGGELLTPRDPRLRRRRRDARHRARARHSELAIADRGHRTCVAGGPRGRPTSCSSPTRSPACARWARCWACAATPRRATLTRALLERTTRAGPTRDPAPRGARAARRLPRLRCSACAGGPRRPAALARRAARRRGGPRVEIEIPRGQPLAATAQQLAARGALDPPALAAAVRARRPSADARIKAGE
ncbi:MAG: hypothetical protein MZV65_53805 [Chromatiales bacterium]|nr:hypothetical protein [Chromatiales bacterium]